MLSDRRRELCEVATTWSATHRDLDELREAANAYTQEEGLSATFFPDRRDELSRGVLAMAITVG